MEGNILKNDAVHQKYFTIFSESPELDGFGGRSWKNEEVPRKQEMSQSGGGKNIFFFITNFCRNIALNS